MLQGVSITKSVILNSDPEYHFSIHLYNKYSSGYWYIFINLVHCDIHSWLIEIVLAIVLMHVFITNLLLIVCKLLSKCTILSIQFIGGLILPWKCCFMGFSQTMQCFYVFHVKYSVKHEKLFVQSFRKFITWSIIDL